MDSHAEENETFLGRMGRRARRWRIGRECRARMVRAGIRTGGSGSAAESSVGAGRSCGTWRSSGIWLGWMYRSRSRRGSTGSCCRFGWEGDGRTRSSSPGSGSSSSGTDSRGGQRASLEMHRGGQQRDQIHGVLVSLLGSERGKHPAPRLVDHQ